LGVSPLFQGRFGAVLVEFESHARVLSRYVHLNPLEAGLTRTPGEYAWSSYRHYLDPHDARIRRPHLSSVTRSGVRHLEIRIWRNSGMIAFTAITRQFRIPMCLPTAGEFAQRFSGGVEKRV